MAAAAEPDSLRKRNVGQALSNDKEELEQQEQEAKDESPDEDELLMEMICGEDDEVPASPTTSPSNTQTIPQGTDLAPEMLDSALQGVSSRWKNWIIRGIFTWVMIFGFMFIIYLGPVALMVLVLLIQVMCFHEVINIGYVVYKTYRLPWFRSLSWYLLLASNYFFYGESMVDYLRVLVRKAEMLQFLITYHRFISFSAYIIGIVWFVLSLIPKHYLKQFSMFAYTHVALLILVTQSHLMIHNIFEGLVWFLVPVSMIICNDIMAYMFGFFFGKTPLIKLSPKKTWEGFIGGMFSTIIFGLILSSILMKYQRFVCPVHLGDDGVTLDCQISATYLPEEYQIPLVRKTVMIVPFHLHTLAMSLFSSIIGPFGGFFASGFKRAFKIKDFGALIPGHGGMMDRFDCQLLMSTFVNVYIYSFIQSPSPDKIMAQIRLLRPEDQLQIFEQLGNFLNASSWPGAS